ncbi:transcription factor Rap1, partial [Histoplasma capsulatum]
MTSPTVVYSGVSSTHDVGGVLFKDTKFWLSRTVPSRSWIIQQIQYIEKSIRSGKRESLEDHRAGPQVGYFRPVGSTTTRQKSYRSAFTARDDQILYDWVKPFEEKGGHIGGNKIYQQLSEKKVKDRPRPVAPEPTVPKTKREPRTDERQQVDTSNTRTPRSGSNRYKHFTEEEKEDLLRHIKDILNIDDGKEDEAWSAYAENTGKSVAEWKSFFQDVILPEYWSRKSRNTASHQALPVAHHDIAASSSIRAKSPEKQHSEKYNLMSFSESGSQQNLTPLDKQRIDIRKRRRSATHLPATEGESESRKRKTVEPTARATTCPSVARQQPDRAMTFTASPTNSPGSSIREPSTHSKSRFPYPSNNENSTSASRAVSTTTTNSASDDRFETAPQFRQDTLESHYQTPPQILDRRHEFNGSPTPQPTPITETNAHADDNPSSLPNDQPSIERLDKWIASKTAGPKASTEQQVLEALACTTMDPDLADTVLEAMATGKGIPDN